MVGRQSKVIVVALSILVGFAVAPGVALTATTDADNATPSVSGVLEQEDGVNTTQEGEGDDANTTLENLTIQTLTLENITVQNAVIEQANVTGENRTNLTANSVTVESATLTNVSLYNLTLTDRELLTAVVGQARATPEQNNSLKSLEISNRTIDGLLIHEAMVQDASGLQLNATEGETGQATQLTADEAQVVVQNVTVESISQNATDDESEAGTETETDAGAGDETETETETEGE